jgi:hypothetical protein
VTGPPTVAVALHDGWYGCGTGAGASNRALLETLAEQLPEPVRLVVLPVLLTDESPEFAPSWHRQMQAVAARREVAVYPVDNGTGGLRRFAGLLAFQKACMQATTLLTGRVLPEAGPVLLLALDAPFTGLPAQLAGQLRNRPELTSVAVPRSTALLHTPADAARIGWELAGLHALAEAGGRVVAISGYMRTHLAADCGVPTSALVDLRNGLTEADWRPCPVADHLVPDAGRAGFLLSLGRAEPYKGFDDLLDALGVLQTGGYRLPHLILAATTETTEASPYQRHLAHRIASERLNATLIRQWQLGMRGLLAHPACRAVVVPSRVEPAGRIPLETYAAGGDAAVVATTAGGLAETVRDGITGYTATPADSGSLATALLRAVAAPEQERQRRRFCGQLYARAEHDYPRNVARFLTEIAPWLTSAAASPTVRR